MQTPNNKNHDSISIQGDGNVIGNGNRVNVNKTGSTPTEYAQAFETIYGALQKISDPAVQQDAKDVVQKIESEIRKGDDADPSRVERWLKFLAEMAPDIKDVVVDTLSNPIKGISTVIAKVIAKAKN